MCISSSFAEFFIKINRFTKLFHCYHSKTNLGAPGKPNILETRAMCMLWNAAQPCSPRLTGTGSIKHGTSQTRGKEHSNPSCFIPSVSESALDCSARMASWLKQTLLPIESPNLKHWMILEKKRRRRHTKSSG